MELAVALERSRFRHQGAYYPPSLVLLALFFVVTLADRHDGPLAIPMFTAGVLLYHLRIRALWADAAYLNYASQDSVRNVLHASVNIGYNLRRQGRPRAVPF